MMTPPGLRERKKQKTRWAIQEHALRLFGEQGYDATTVEQIAAAAEISPSTFFRYFRTKEDLVVEDEYDPMMIQLFQSAPAGLAPLPALRHALRAAFTQIDAGQRRKILERTRLVLSVPALRARTLENLNATIGMIAGLAASRFGPEAGEFAVRTFAGACMGVWLVAIQEWVDSDGEKDLAELMDEALSNLESGFSMARPV